ncbi:MAG: hypothetical protein PHY48_00890 [Candidatus Cloacimonetes bacterium]|nr:hypothetical protein [Candidatus Cloacimonadota bacterium]
MSDKLTDPKQILEKAYRQALSKKDKSFLKGIDVKENIAYVCRYEGNRAGVRLLISCLLAKVHNPVVDPRKPYTEINEADCFSGRTYDEKYITHFVSHYRLPVNPTTAFLTPALRNINQALTKDRNLEGRPRELYSKTLLLLDDVAENIV